MSERLNVYGDRLVSTGVHGADIAAQRMDDLDVKALIHALQRKEKGAAIDFGCGTGIQGLRFATFGYQTILIDWIPEEQTIVHLSGLAAVLPVSYLRKDARLLQPSDVPDRVAICYSQRFVHYLRFHEAVDLLRLLRGRMAPDGKLFLSASGIESELGRDYPDVGKALETRFAELESSIAVKHGILEPVCLYSKEDMSVLGRAAGFLPEDVYVSAFGNVKGIFAVAE